MQSFLACQLIRRHAAVHERRRENTTKQMNVLNSLSRLQLAKLRPCRRRRSSSISRPSHCVRGSVAISRAMSLLILMRRGALAICRSRGCVTRWITRRSVGRICRGVIRGTGRVVVASTEDAAQSHAHARSAARWRRLCGVVGESMLDATVGESQEEKSASWVPSMVDSTRWCRCRIWKLVVAV